MALNSHDVPPPDYRMWNTYKVDQNHSPAHIAGWSSVVAAGSPAGKLKSMVLNSHGSPGRLHIGTGFGLADAAQFSKVNGLVHSIFIVACQIAMIGGGAT